MLLQVRPLNVDIDCGHMDRTWIVRPVDNALRFPNAERSTSLQRSKRWSTVKALEKSENPVGEEWEGDTSGGAGLGCGHLWLCKRLAVTLE